VIWIVVALVSGLVLFIAGGLDDIRRVHEEERAERLRAASRHPSGRALPADRQLAMFILDERREDIR
jgi:hypothetical protein